MYIESRMEINLNGVTLKPQSDLHITTKDIDLSAKVEQLNEGWRENAL